MQASKTELALGSVQWGLDYGIANQRGQASEAQVREMLALAHAAGVDTLDTARAYGEAEAVIGRALAGGELPFKVVTKLSPGLCEHGVAFDALDAAVGKSLSESREALGRVLLDAVLLHRPEHRHVANERVWRALKAEQESGGITKIGVSATSPQSAMDALEDPDVQVMQVATSLLDRRLVESGFFTRAAERGVEVHVRSLFLQGVAFMEPKDLPVHLQPLAPSLERIRDWARRESTSPETAFLAYGLSLGASRLVVGCERPEQVARNLKARTRALSFVSKVTTLSAELPVLSDALLDPSRWPARA